MAEPTNQPKKINVRMHEQYTPFTSIAILLPFIGIVLGIIYLCKPDKFDRKLGEHTLAASIVFIIIWSIVFKFIF